MVGREPQPAADLVELLHLGGHHLEVVAGHEHLTEPVLRREARRRLGGERGLDPRGEVALVAGLRPDRGRRDLEDLSVEREALGAVGGSDRVDDVVEVGVRLLDRDAEGRVLVRRHAAPDAEVQAATLEEDVEHRQLARQPDRVPPRRDHHRGPEVDSRRAPRPVREVLQRIGLHRIGGAVVLGGPDRVEAERLDELAQAQRLVHVDVVRDVGRTLVLAGHQPRPVALVVPRHHDSAVHELSLDHRRPAAGQPIAGARRNEPASAEGFIPRLLTQVA